MGGETERLCTEEHHHRIHLTDFLLEPLILELQASLCGELQNYKLPLFIVFKATQCYLKKESLLLDDTDITLDLFIK